MSDFDIDESIDVDISEPLETTSLDSTIDVMDSADIPEDTFDAIDFDESSLENYDDINEEDYNSEVDEVMNEAEFENLEFESESEELPGDSLDIMDDTSAEELEFDDEVINEDFEFEQEELEQSLEENVDFASVDEVEDDIEINNDEILFEESEQLLEEQLDEDIGMIGEDEIENVQEEVEISDETDTQTDLDQMPEDQVEEITDALGVEEIENVQELAEISNETDLQTDFDQMPEDQVEEVTDELGVEETESIQENIETSNEMDIQTDFEQISEDTESVDSHEALSSMSEYMNEHNYGLDDYETYSKDPEWQALNRDLNVANGLEPTEEIGIQEVAQDVFENSSEIIEQYEDASSNLESQIENASDIEELTNIRNQILQEGLPEQGNNQSNFETQIENATSVEELAQIRNQILQEGLPEQNTRNNEEFAINENIDDSPKTLTRDITSEILEGRSADIEEVLENYGDNLREYGVDENAIEQFLSQERDKMNAEFESLDRGDLESAHYDVPTDWEGIADGLKANGMDQTNVAEDMDSSVSEIETIDPSEIDYDEVFEGLDSYDFDGVDYLQDAERLDSSLTVFQPERWQEMDLNQQKEAMTELAEYVQEVTGLENPPTIEFYNNPVDGDYGGFMASTNTLSINEHMLYDSNEAADTVAHELWHAYQHERAMNPQSAKDYQYQYNFEHYISPKSDMSGHFVNFTEYQDQLVEAEARAFAEQFKGRISEYGKSN